MARKLDRLQAANMTNRGIQTWSQRVAEQIEAQFDDIQQQVTDIAAALAAATAAQTTADAAQTTANTVQRDDAIADSYTVPGTVLSATDTGSAAKITAAAHTRKYNDGTSASVNSDNVSGLSYSTVYYVYYDQASRAGGAVSIHATTDAKTAAAGTVAGRHYLGKITTPAAGAGDTSGGNAPPVGGGGITPDNVF